MQSRQIADHDLKYAENWIRLHRTLYSDPEEDWGGAAARRTDSAEDKQDDLAALMQGLCIVEVEE